MNEIVNVTEVINMPTGNKNSLNLSYNILLHKKNNQQIFLNDIKTHINLFIYNCHNCAIYIHESELKVFNRVAIVECTNLQIYIQKNIHILNLSISNNIDIYSFFNINEIKVNASADVTIHSFSKLMHGIPVIIAGGIDIKLNLVDRRTIILLCNMFFEGFLNIYDRTNDSIFKKTINITRSSLLPRI